MGQAGFTQRFVNVMLGWIRGVAGGVAAMFQSSGGSGPSTGSSLLTWFSDNWIKLLIALILSGIVVDWIVWMLRWRPYWLWFRKRRVLLDDDLGDVYQAEKRPARARGSRERFHSTALRRDDDDDERDLTADEYEDGYEYDDDYESDRAYEDDDFEDDGEYADDGDFEDDGEYADDGDFEDDGEYDADDRDFEDDGEYADDGDFEDDGEYADDRDYEDDGGEAEPEKLGDQSDSDDEDVSGDWIEPDGDAREQDEPAESGDRSEPDLDETAQADAAKKDRRSQKKKPRKPLFGKHRAALEDEDPFEVDIAGLDEDEAFYAALNEPRKPLTQSDYSLYARPTQPETQPETNTESASIKTDGESVKAETPDEASPDLTDYDAPFTPVAGTALSRSARRMRKREGKDD